MSISTARGFWRPTLVALVVSASPAGCNRPSPTRPRLFDLPGRLASTRAAEVRTQVSGIIRERAFAEGSLVRTDDVLFRIDPAVYRTEADAKAASIARAEASRVQALKQSERTETLLDRRMAAPEPSP